MTVLAVDIGGTKTALALVGSQGEIRAKEIQSTDADHPETTIRQILAFAQGHAIKAVGVCVPAVLEHATDRLLWLPNLQGWNGYPLRETLTAGLGCPVALEYDGHAAVLGEWWAGAARGCQSVASIIIGTGIGGGFVVDGRLWRGRDRLAGAVGWIPLAGPDGIDHWENLASGPAVARRLTQLRAAGGVTRLTGEITARDVFDAARQGDALARQVVDEAALYIGYGTAAVISLVNPQMVVLGGSVGQQADLLLDTVQQTVARWAQPVSARDVPIVCSTLGEDANLLGMTYVAHTLQHSFDES
jgi:glucokinase